MNSLQSLVLQNLYPGAYNVINQEVLKCFKIFRYGIVFKV